MNFMEMFKKVANSKGVIIGGAIFTGVMAVVESLSDHQKEKELTNLKNDVEELKKKL